MCSLASQNCSIWLKFCEACSSEAAFNIRNNHQSFCWDLLTFMGKSGNERNVGVLDFLGASTSVRKVNELASLIVRLNSDGSTFPHKSSECLSSNFSSLDRAIDLDFDVDIPAIISSKNPAR